MSRFDCRCKSAWWNNSVRLKNTCVSIDSTDHTFLPIGLRLFKTNDVVSYVSLKFRTLISEICQFFCSKKCEKLLQCK